MTDNASIDPGSNLTLPVATDEIGGAHFQKVKLIDPTPDSTTGIGTASNPLRTDPTGTTPQPVSGTVNVGTVTTVTNVVHVDDNSGSLTIDDGGGSITVDGVLSANAIDQSTTGTITGNGQQVTLSGLSAKSSATIQLSGTWTGTIAFEITNNGSTWVNIQGDNYAGTNLAFNATANGIWGFRVAGIVGIRANSTAWSSGTANVSIIATVGVGIAGNPSQIPAGGNIIGGFSVISSSVTPGTSATHLGKAQDGNVGSTDTGVAIQTARRDTLASGATGTGKYSILSTNSEGALWTTDQKPGTGTQTSVAGSASDVTILAANTSRKGATISNDSSAILYLLLGSGTSSTTNYSVKLFQDDVFELPAPVYTGIIKGIWASATGSARVTEQT